MVAYSPLLKLIADRVLSSRSGARYDSTNKNLDRNIGVKLRALVKSNKKSSVGSLRSVSATFEQPLDIEHDTRGGIGNIRTYQARIQAQQNPYLDRDVSGRMAFGNEQIAVTRQAIVTSS
ncbi:hypothetical protein F4813DRAFT_396488 [Daldinia decipiens]|uniref:uncharacterized protein n=1 Tax=Daldinia decipiens TaxID=326647 RepID=UPI0020C479A9|nr:uncharacterized protein F4813DRAFT_396488 [Daldinia decipiens]KAI1657311.1 hypothetical protein F4813DRAFT_396488 [Daldinia decipiens]